MKANDRRYEIIQRGDGGMFVRDAIYNMGELRKAFVIGVCSSTEEGKQIIKNHKEQEAEMARRNKLTVLHSENFDE